MQNKSLVDENANLVQTQAKTRRERDQLEKALAEAIANNEELLHLMESEKRKDEPVEPNPVEDPEDDSYLTALKKIQDENKELAKNSIFAKAYSIIANTEKKNWAVEMVGSNQTTNMVFEILHNSMVLDHSIDLKFASEQVAEIVDQKIYLLNSRIKKQRKMIEHQRKQLSKANSQIPAMMGHSSNNERVFFECVSAVIHEAEERK